MQLFSEVFPEYIAQAYGKPADILLRSFNVPLIDECAVDVGSVLSNALAVLDGSGSNDLATINTSITPRHAELPAPVRSIVEDVSLIYFPEEDQVVKPGSQVEKLSSNVPPLVDDTTNIILFLSFVSYLLYCISLPQILLIILYNNSINLDICNG